MAGEPPNAIGPYRIVREIGRGGMGVVYLARDARLDRDVAIKALPAELAWDTGRLERFEREARTLASLNHPNIGAIYGVEEQGGQKYLVLEFVEGETLADRLDRGPLAVDEAAEVAVQIAAGVEAAHEAGVVHRDLKPANIKVTPEGKVKVLDFGLARSDGEGSQTSSGLSQTPTMTTPVARHSPTLPGAILGTAAYMSPEQARGRRVDRRTDVWSFGVILFEMLVGASPFVGETASDSIGAVLHKSFDLGQLPAETPANVRRVLRRCLERDRSLRYRDIGDVRLELLMPEDSGVGDQQRSSPVLPWVTAVSAVVLAIGGLVYGLTRSREAPETPRRQVKFAVDCPLEMDPGSRVQPVVEISPDGTRLAMQGESVSGPIFIRRMDQTLVEKLDMPWHGALLEWTPDSRGLLVQRNDGQRSEIWRVGLDGEEPRRVCQLPNDGFLWGDSVAALDENTLVLGMAYALYTVPLAGGEPREMLRGEKGELLVQPTPIPGTDAVLFLEVTAGRVEMLRGGKRSVVVDLGGDRVNRLTYDPSGRLLVSIFSGERGQGTWSIAFDSQTLKAAGDPVMVLPLCWLSLSDNGTLAYGPVVELPTESRSIVWVTRAGDIEDRIGIPLPGASHPSLSPDGKRIAVSAYAASTLDAPDRTTDLFVVDASTGSRAELNDPLGSDGFAFWRGDNETIVFTTYNAGIRRAREVSASGTAQPVTIDDRSLIAMPSRDDRYLITSLDKLSYIESGSDQEHVFGEEGVRDFDLTSDSRYLAYGRGTDRGGLLLQRFPEGGALTTITVDEVSGVRWNADDTGLFYWVDEDLYAVEVDLAGPQPIVGTPERLFNAEEVGVRDGRNYDIAADGRFLMLLSPEGAMEAPESVEVLVVQGWSEGGQSGRGNHR